MKYKLPKRILCVFIVLTNALCLLGKDPDWLIGPFVRPETGNPVIKPIKTEFYCPMNKRIIKWEEGDTFNPAAVLKDNKIVVLYRAEDLSGKGIGNRTSRIGYAETTDGISMNRQPYPVLYPDNDKFRSLEWRGGCEDPRVVMTEDGMYVMLYTAWNRDNPDGVSRAPRLCVATSYDLKNWKKHGLAFGKCYNGRFKDMGCKSASVVTEIKDDKIVVSKVNGKYFMYWGEHAVCAAVSDDLINWEPLLNSNGELYKIIQPREGYFDSQLTECGPPALKSKDGIVLIYNGKNGSKEKGDKSLAPYTYSAGQLLLDKNNPLKVIDRMDKPFFRPQMDYEKKGQYASGTVFTESLVYKDGKLYMYYGCADSFVSVAVCEYNY